MEPPITDTPKKPFKCVIADDSEFARRNMAKIVSLIGGEVVGMAANGVEAVELYFSLKPDLLLLDITMPVLDGVDTLRRIMEKDKTAKVVIVSSLSHKEMIQTAMALGAKDIIPKPYNLDSACTIIKSALENGGK